MNEQNKKEMVTLWALIAEMYGKSKDIAGLMAKMSLQEGLTASQVADAWREWMRQGKSAMPTFGDLLKILKPESNTSARQLATQIASIIPYLISKHGYYWPIGVFNGGKQCFEGKDGIFYDTFDQALESYLGAVSLLVKDIWSDICLNWDENQTTNFAQLRDRIEAEIIVSSENMRQQALAIANQHRELITQSQKLLLAQSVAGNTENLEREVTNETI